MENSFLVIDSGSTKADWQHFPSYSKLTTKGFNPFYFKTHEIVQELRNHIQFLSQFYDTSTVYWYGSGCSNPQKNEVILQALKFFFPKSQIIIEHDLLGAARALLGKNKGIACILGTGSNSCLYDGDKILENIPSLGFLLGDEGSASHISKKFLKALFYGELMSETTEAFHKQYSIERTAFLNELYHSKEPNLMVAQFSIFLSENIHFPDIQRTVKDSFREFFNHHVARYLGFHELPIAFTGSVANAFEPILKEVVKEWNGNFFQVVKNPIDHLLEFHIKNKIF